jgi:RNA polymerase sigma factor (sigma-70 family)
MEATDAALIAASLEDPQAFVAIFERHFGSISRYLRRRLRRMVADDLAAEVFAIAFSRRFAFDLDRPDALPWLYGIAANLLRARARMEQRELHALAQTGIDPVTAGVSDAAVDSALEPVLAQALLELGPADREVLLLFALGDLSYEQIAVALELPVGTVRSRLNRARRFVRHRLDVALIEEASHG